MAAMTGPEFQDFITNPANGGEQATVEQFTVMASAVIASVSISPEKFDKDLIVEALQILSRKMPTELVIAGTAHSMAVHGKLTSH